MPSGARSEAVNCEYSLDDMGLKMNLFSLCVFIEIGAQVGGFRYIYARFLDEAAAVTGSSELGEITPLLNESGTLFSDIGRLGVGACFSPKLPGCSSTPCTVMNSESKSLLTDGV